VESRRRPEDHIVVLGQDPRDEAGASLVADVPPLEERLLDRVHRSPRSGVVGDEAHCRVVMISPCLQATQTLMPICGHRLIEVFLVETLGFD
jgi:hypothetical protein